MPAMPSSAWQYAQENATAESPDTRAARRWPSSKRQLREAPLDALMHIPKPLLEAEDLLADNRESKVAGLDDAGVHGADGNLVDAVALDSHECHTRHAGLVAALTAPADRSAAEKSAARRRDAATGGYPGR